ncbi:MAG: Hpt domain-containing protein [Desulfobulbaceae bacterium]|nr:Hpt domain-containing protein [Desulfobulbaceae bacterium]
MSTSPQLLDTLCKAVEDTDSETVYKTAHTVKSSSANVGALHLAGLCNILEGMGLANEMEKSGELLALIEQEFALVVKSLKNEIHD